MPRGSLYDLLHRSRGPPLDWRRRIRVSLHAARGMAFLHAQVRLRPVEPREMHRGPGCCSVLTYSSLTFFSRGLSAPFPIPPCEPQRPPIIHRDLKTANLLIGANFMCKVRLRLFDWGCYPTLASCNHR